RRLSQPLDDADTSADQGKTARAVSREDGRMPLLALEEPVGTRSSEASVAPGWADVVDAAVGHVWPGIVMGAMRVAGRLVRPVVEALPAAVERLRVGAGPELDRSTLAMWESWQGDMGVPPPQPPVRIVGFVVEG